MKISINVKANGSDSYSLPQSQSQKLITINSIVIGDSESSSVSEDVRLIFKIKQLEFTEVGIDILNLGIAAYTIDQLVSRGLFGYIQWNRHLLVHLPVYNLTKWKTVQNEIEQTFSFLSGDKWEFKFRKREKQQIKKKASNNHAGIQSVSLFSGGLDSLIGVIDLLESQKIAVVGHHKVGGMEKSAQESLLEELKKQYGKESIVDFLFYVQPKKSKNKDLGNEITQRARSILYIALGIAVANSLGDEIPLYIPENGLISLNIPLTSNRQGTYSTKTTHPYFLSRLREILQQISVYNEIINPYQFCTKGEMVLNSKNSKLVKKLANQTISCSKPNNYRRWHRSENSQCGHCVPCIIRRAALYKAKMDDPNDYVSDVRSFGNNYNGLKGTDLRAFNIALYRYLIKKKIGVFDVLKSGALPAEDILKYLSVTKRGLDEVSDFLTPK